MIGVAPVVVAAEEPSLEVYVLRGFLHECSDEWTPLGPAEWVVDQYNPEAYGKLSADGVSDSPLVVATKEYPRSVRGGSWDDDPEMLRSAARRGSDENWKIQDPQIPKSVWYHTDAHGVGFRLIRPRSIPPKSELHKYWPTAKELSEVPQR